MSMEMHVVPLGDAVEHQSDFECVCGPALDIYDRGAVFTHHSLDGREKSE